MNNLSLDEASYQTWQSALEAKRQELETEIAALQPQEVIQPGLTGRSSEGDLPVAQQILSAPVVSSTAQPPRPEQAERNLKRFNQISRAVFIILLAWLGMIDLYGNKPIFGSDPLRDYFALLAWGFGAEVTRESVVRATQELGIPLTK